MTWEELTNEMWETPGHFLVKVVGSEVVKAVAHPEVGTIYLYTDEPLRPLEDKVSARNKHK